MSWFYYNQSGEKIGPKTADEIIQLARQGTIIPSTRIEAPNGNVGPAEKVKGKDGKGLPFPEEIPVEKENTIVAYKSYLVKYPNAANRSEALMDMYQLIKQENTIAAYEDYYFRYPNAPNRNEALTDMFKLIKRENTIASYTYYCSAYPNAPNRNDALTDMYELIKQENTIVAYEFYYSKYRKAPNRNEALADMYGLVKTENNVACYAWFLEKFSDVPQAVDALSRLHAEVFKAAQQFNTIEAYNDFTIAYPLAREVNIAYGIAYELEKKRYAPANANEKEEKARLLLNKSRRIWLNGDIEPPDRQIGYLLIVQRMTKLLENEFPAQKATSEMLDSEETRRFRKKLQQSLGLIQESLYRFEEAARRIHETQEQIKRLIKEHMDVMKYYLGAMKSELHSISFNTRQTAENTREIAWNTHAIAGHTQAIAGTTRSIADGTWEIAGNTRAIANDTWEIAESTQSIASQIPRMADTLNRQVQSQDYLNWHIEQFKNWAIMKRDEDERFRMIGGM